MEGNLSGSSVVNALMIDGNNVYACGRFYEDGSDGTSAKVWKNGQPLYTFKGNIWLSQLVMSGKDLYIAGNTHPEENMDYPQAKVWKNGKPPYSLPGGRHAYASSIVLVEAQ